MQILNILHKKLEKTCFKKYSPKCLFLSYMCFSPMGLFSERSKYFLIFFIGDEKKNFGQRCNKGVVQWKKSMLDSQKKQYSEIYNFFWLDIISDRYL